MDKWDVPLKGESWTADQLAKYLGLVFNEDVETNGGPPYLLDNNGALVSVVRENISLAMKPKEKPMVVLPNSMRMRQ